MEKDWERVFVKVAEQVLRGTGSTNTPEPEELKEVTIRGKDLHPSNGLVCEKPIRRSTPNKTFHRYCRELWSIRAGRGSICPCCKQEVKPGEEITLFEKVPGWSHLYHATDEEVTTPETPRLNVGGD